MRNLWRQSRYLLHYKRLLSAAVLASLGDALCAFGGFGGLMWIIDQMFRADVTIRELAVEAASGDLVRGIVGDLTPIIEAVIPASRFGGFIFMLAVIFSLASVGAVFRYAHAAMVGVAIRRANGRLRFDLFCHVMKLAPMQLQQAGPSDLISRMSSDASAVFNGLDMLFGKSLRNIFIGAVMLVLAFLVDWQLTALFLMGLPMLGLLIRKFGKKMRRVSTRTLRAQAELLHSFQEPLLNFEVVKLHEAERAERRRMGEILRRLVGHQIRAMRIKALSQPVIEYFAMVGVMGLALVAGYYIFEMDQSPTNLIKVLGVLAVSASRFKPLVDLYNTLQVASASADRIDEVQRMPIEADPPHARALPRHHGGIRFEGVSFTYPGKDEPALQDVSLDVAYGQTIAVVGPNGSGKSTLLSLLPRLIEPDAGRVMIDGHDVRDVTLRSLRSQIAVVSQKAALFKMSIQANIAYGRVSASEARIIEAAHAAWAHEFVEPLPEQYRTLLSEGGRGLSGGQQQRLCIARAILRDPAILILDEATSQIDTDSEEKINRAIRELRQDRTTFIIAHRLSTVIDADAIVVMDFGRIVDIGDHATLSRRCGLYQTLAHGQLIGGPRAGKGDAGSPADAGASDADPTRSRAGLNEDAI